MKARPYQIKAIKAATKGLCDNRKSGLVVIPTGGGKTFVCSEIIKSVLSRYPSINILCLSHREELIRQSANSLKISFGEKVGVFAASLGIKQIGKQITVAQVQSIWRSIESIKQNWSLVVIDEAHLLSQSTKMYGNIAKETLSRRPSRLFLGLTATPWRLDEGHLVEGDLFDCVFYECKMNSLVRDGYLCPLIGLAPVGEINSGGIPVRGSEFVQSIAEKRAIDASPSIVSEMIKKCELDGRRSVLVFCAGREHARVMLRLINESGWECEIVDGETPKHERQAIIEAFGRGDLRCVVNISCLTTGLDVPRIDCVVVARLTMSRVLWVQMAGRGSRIHTDKRDCLILDFGGNALRHGPVDSSWAKSKNKKKSHALKVCPDCRLVVSAGLKICSCGHEFGITIGSQKGEGDGSLLFEYPSEAAITVNGIKPIEMEIDSVLVSEHVSKSGRNCILIQFLGFFDEKKFFVVPGIKISRPLISLLTRCLGQDWCKILKEDKTKATTNIKNKVSKIKVKTNERGYPELVGYSLKDGQ